MGEIPAISSGSIDRTTAYFKPAKVIAKFVYDKIFEKFKENQGVIDYQALAREVINFATDGNKLYSIDDLRNLFELAREEAKTYLAERSMDAGFYNVAADRLFQEINKTLLTNEPPPDDAEIRRYPLFRTSYVPNASPVTGFLDVWKKMNSRGLLNAGVYRSGDPGVAATPYTSFKYNFLDVDYGPFNSAIISGVGAFWILPDSNFTNRYILGIDPSLILFQGAEFELLHGLDLRLAAQSKMIMPVGIHLPLTTFIWPLEAGASVKYRPLILGAMITYHVYPNDVQDVSSVRPNYDHTTAYAGLQTPIADTRLAVDFFRDTTMVSTALSKTLSILGTDTTFAISGVTTVQAEQGAPQPPYILFSIVSASDQKQEKGVTMGISVDPTFERRKIGSYVSGEPEFQPSEIAYNFTTDNTILFLCEKGSFHEGMYETNCLNAQTGSYTACVKTAKGTDKLRCSSSDGVVFQLKDSYKYDGVSYFHKLEEIDISNTHPILKSLFENEDYSSFIMNGSLEWSSHQKLLALNTLAKLAYKTYEEESLTNPFSGDTNTIGYDEIYNEMRRAIFDPRNRNKTTVCRGIAKFIAHTASLWGFEARAVVLQTAKIGHVVAMVREPGEEYKFIDYGDGIVFTKAHTDLEAIQSFIMQNADRYPPQIVVRIYDSNGKFVRALYTNEGRLLMESTTPDRIEDYLNFSD